MGAPSFIPRISKVTRGDWLVLPSGRTVQVCKVIGDARPEVSLRYLNDDGVQSTGSFDVKLAWLLKNAKRA